MGEACSWRNGPDGLRIAYQGVNARGQVCAVAANGLGTSEVVLQWGSGPLGLLDWSPSGEQVVSAREPLPGSGAVSQIVVTDADGTEVTTLGEGQMPDQC